MGGGGKCREGIFTLVAVSLFRAEGSMEKHQAAIGMLILPHSIKCIRVDIVSKGYEVIMKFFRKTKG